MLKNQRKKGLDNIRKMLRGMAHNMNLMPRQISERLYQGIEPRNGNSGHKDTRNDKKSLYEYYIYPFPKSNLF